MRIRTWNAAAAAVALTLTTVVVGGATASASPPTQIGSGVVDAGLGNCTFPVEISRVGTVESVDKMISGRNGEIRVFGGTRLIFTNVDSGKTLRLPAAGVVKSQAQADGSTSVNVNGNYLVIASGIPGLADGIYVLTGKTAYVLSSNGDLVASSSSGRTFDVCKALA